MNAKKFVKDLVGLFSPTQEKINWQNLRDFNRSMAKNNIETY